MTELLPRVDAIVASRKLSAGRPCELGDPSPLASKGKKYLFSGAETRSANAGFAARSLQAAIIF